MPRQNLLLTAAFGALAALAAVADLVLVSNEVVSAYLGNIAVLCLEIVVVVLIVELFAQRAREDARLPLRRLAFDDARALVVIAQHIAFEALLATRSRSGESLEGLSSMKLDVEACVEAICSADPSIHPHSIGFPTLAGFYGNEIARLDNCYESSKVVIATGADPALASAVSDLVRGRGMSFLQMLRLFRTTLSSHQASMRFGEMRGPVRDFCEAVRDAQIQLEASAEAFGGRSVGSRMNPLNRLLRRTT